MNLARNAPTDDKPLTLLQINKISPVMAVRAEDCSICYMKVFPKTMVPKLPCPHLYHTKCITAWLQKNPNCPMCRKHVLSHWNVHDRKYIIHKLNSPIVNHSVKLIWFLGFILLSPSSKMQALQTLLLVMKPHFSHFCLFIGFFFSFILMHSAE